MTNLRGDISPEIVALISNMRPCRDQDLLLNNQAVDKQNGFVHL